MTIHWQPRWPATYSWRKWQDSPLFIFTKNMTLTLASDLTPNQVIRAVRVTAHYRQSPMTVGRGQGNYGQIIWLSQMVRCTDWICNQGSFGNDYVKFNFDCFGPCMFYVLYWYKSIKHWFFRTDETPLTEQMRSQLTHVWLIKQPYVLIHAEK